MPQNNPFTHGGERHQITRIEFEPLENGIVRWSAWNGDRRLLQTSAAAGDPAALQKMLETTRILVTAVAEGAFNHAEEEIE